jgi:phosphatidylserine decarboxylase
MIRFGSRVDVFIPTSSKLRANLNQATTAGVTVLAELP